MSKARKARRRRAVTAGELRLTLLAGLALGLVYVQADGGWGAAANAMPQAAVPAALAPRVAAQFAPSRADVRVIDGDTFRYGGETVRIADIDTPETRPSRCPYEAELGERATRRLGALLGEGPFELLPADRDEDRYGRKLRIVMRDGRSLGAVLVAEGLAREWTGRREPWCA